MSKVADLAADPNAPEEGHEKGWWPPVLPLRVTLKPRSATVW